MATDEKPHGGMAVMMALKPKGGMDHPEPDDDDMGGPPDMDEDDQGDGQEYGFKIGVPHGYQPPEGKEAGMEYDVTAKVHMDKSGKCIVIDQLEGIPTHEGEEDQGPPEPTEEADTGGEGEGEQNAPQEPDAAKALMGAVNKMRGR